MTYDLRPCGMDVVEALCARFHGYGSAGKVAAYAFAVYEEGQPVAAYAWQPPPPGAAASVCPEVPGAVLALSRMVAVPRDERALNHVSKPLRMQMKRLIDRRRWPVLVTYSDEGQGHTGHVYKCSGWLPTARMTRRTYHDADGRRVSAYANGKSGGRAGLTRGPDTVLQRWEHWACPVGAVADWMAAGGWRNVEVPGRTWRSGSPARTWVRGMPNPVDTSVHAEVQGSTPEVSAVPDLRAVLLAGLADLDATFAADLVDEILALRATATAPVVDVIDDRPDASAGVFVELCAGTAAVSLALLGGRAPVPFAGSKRSFVKQLFVEMGVDPSQPPDQIHLVDCSEWGRTLQAMKTSANAIADVFDTWAEEPDARELFDRLRTTAPPDDPVLRAAAHLFLQARTYRGKPVYPTEDGWKTHGFDPEHRAEAVNPGSHVRGWYNSRPTLARKLREIAQLDWSRVTIHRMRVQDFEPIPSAKVLFDPPYAGSPVHYGEGIACSRDDVLAVARAHHAAVCDVYVTEGADLASDLPGFHGRRMLSSRHGVFKSADRTPRSQLGSHQEWLTSSTPPVASSIEPSPIPTTKDNAPMARSRYFRHIVHVRSSAKGGVDTPLHPKTLIVGPNASRKDRLTQAAALALGGFVHDLGGKDVRQPVDLLALAPQRDGVLFAHATFDDGSVATFRTRGDGPGKSTGTEHILPAAGHGRPAGTAVALLAVSEIREVLTRKGDEARRQFFLDLIGTGLNDEAVLKVLAEPRHADFAALAADARREADVRGAAILSAVIGLAKKRKSEATAEVKAAKSLIERLAETVALAPAAEAVEAARGKMEALAQQVKETPAPQASQPAGPTAGQIDAWEAELAGQQARRTQALEALAAWEHKLAGIGPALSETDLEAIADLRKKWQAVSRMARDQLVAVEAGTLAHCALCSGHGHYVDGNGTRHQLTVTLDPELARQSAAQLAQVADQWFAHLDGQEATSKQRAEAETAMVPIRQYVAQVDAWIAAETARIAQARASMVEAASTSTPTPTATAMTAWQEAQRTYQALQTAFDQYASVQRARTQKARAEDEVGRWDRLVAACEEATTTLLGQARGDFVQAVQSFMPDAEKMPAGGMFDLRLVEGSRQVCQVGLLKDGEWHTALSGAEWTIVTTALACVLGTRRAEIAVVIPEDRDIDPETLANTMRALADAPCQILWSVTKTPKGRTPAGWTVIEAPKVAVTIPEDAPFVLEETGADEEEKEVGEPDPDDEEDEDTGKPTNSTVLELDASALPAPQGAPSWWDNRGPTAWRGIFADDAKVRGRGEPFAAAFGRFFPGVPLEPTETWMYEPEDGTAQRLTLYANGAVLRAFTPTRTTAADGSLGPEPSPFSEGFLFKPAELPPWAAASALGGLAWTGEVSTGRDGFRATFGCLPITLRSHDVRKGTWRQYDNGAVGYQSGKVLTFYRGTARLAAELGEAAAP